MTYPKLTWREGREHLLLVSNFRLAGYRGYVKAHLVPRSPTMSSLGGRAAIILFWFQSSGWLDRKGL